MQKNFRNGFWRLLVFGICVVGSPRFVCSQEFDFGDLSTPQIHRNSARVPTPQLNPNPVDVPQKFGALLLKTGAMFEGEITRNNNDYVISRPVGRSKIPAYTVEYVGVDRYDIYQYKRRQPITASYDGTFNLGKWCLSNGMYDEAIAEFQSCKRFAPFPQAVKALDNEIAAAQRVQRTSARKQEQNNDSPGSLQGDRSLKTLTDDLDTFDYKSWGMTIEPKIYDKFQKEVEPLLIKRCGSASCHGSNSQQEFRLHRSGMRFSQTESTARNLKATFERIDFQQPQASPLLQRPQQAHGGSKPIFHRQSRNAWNTISQWIHLIPNTMPKLADEYIAIAKSKATQTLSQDEPELKPAIQQTSYLEKSDPAPIPQVPIQEREASETSPFLPQKQPPQLRPSDPFDPSQFNQRFHK